MGAKHFIDKMGNFYALFSVADKLAAAKFPPMTMEEIQEEVNAVRAQRKQRAPAT